MHRILQKLPLPISGLMLGLAVLGNLLGAYHSGIRYALGAVSGIIFIALVMKILLFPGSIREGFLNPVVAGTMATFPMAMVLLSTYIRPILPTFAFWAWAVGIFLNIVLIVLFTIKYMLRFSIHKVFASYFVLYVGIVVASVTAPAYGMHRVGQAIFWFGLASYILLVPLVSYRELKVGDIPEPLQPVTIIYAAPASLLLAGYVSSFPVKSLTMVVILGVWGFLMTIFCLIRMPRLLNLPFYPSCAAFTFPFVISASAFTGMKNVLATMGYKTFFFEPIQIFLISWAVIMVLFVFLRYIMFMSGAAELRLPAQPMVDSK
jgi:exfoliative toxin A/B